MRASFLLLCSCAALQSFVAKVSMINLLDEDIIFNDCASSHANTIQEQPAKGAITKPGEEATFVLNASHILQALDGQCWWNTTSNFDCFKNGSGVNGTTPKPPGKVTSCPYISWSRGISIKTKSFGASWEFDGPYESEDKEWQEPGKTHRRFCACKKGTSRNDCKDLCNSPPTPAPPPSPQPKTHYTNPKTGCAYGEMAMEVDKSGAQICMPECHKSSGIIPHEKCSTDVPAGVTANPSCGFIDYDTDIKYCSLNCRVDPVHKMLCDEGATCFETTIPPMPPIQNHSTVQGYCGYNQTQPK